MCIRDSPSALAEREGVVLDDRVGEQLAAHVVDLRAGGLGGETVTGDGEVDDLADLDTAHTCEPEVGERALDGGTLRVEDALLGRDAHADVHRLTCPERECWGQL